MGLNWDEDSTATVAQNAPAPAKEQIDFSKIDINDIKLGDNVDWDNMICDSCQ
jgi:hypothetical protein